MNPTVLSALIQANLAALDPSLAKSPTYQQFCDAFAKAIVTHITTSAIVLCDGKQGTIK
jgi:hypothetical protein